MTYRVSKEFHFSSSHQLHGLREGHPCGRIHGHNYIVRLALSAPQVDEIGFLLDYNEMKPFGQWLDENVDHRHLNDVLPIHPTAENMSRFFAEKARDLIEIPSGVRISVEVSETPKTWAEWKEEA